MNLPITLRDDSVRLDVLVQPKTSKNLIAGIHEGRLKVRLMAPPVDGAANKACLKFLAKSFGLPVSRVSLVQGETSRKKTLQFDGIDPEQFRARLHQLLGAPTHRK